MPCNALLPFTVMLDIYRVVVTGSANGRWYLTPLLNDGTAGEARTFDSAEAAREFAASAYPGKPIGGSKKKRARPYKRPRISLPFFD